MKKQAYADPKRQATADRQAAWYSANRERLKERQTEYNRKTVDARRDSHLRRLYGISSADYDQMLQDQGGRCAICKSEDPACRHSRFHVDHDHVTGSVRGLLCSHCNTALGKFKDSQSIITSALQYLAQHSS